MSNTPDFYLLKKAAYTVTETMEFTNQSRGGLYSAVRKGKIRMVKSGSKSLFLAPDIAAYLDSLTASSDVVEPRGAAGRAAITAKFAARRAGHPAAAAPPEAAAPPPKKLRGEPKRRRAKAKSPQTPRALEAAEV